MAIRVSGLSSGLDTESIVQALVSAYSVKKQSYEKSMTKQSWTMDAWKTVNSKVYSFYSTTLDSMRFSTNYNLKTTSISNSSIATVTASNDAVNGTQSLSVKQLAKSGYLTGAKLTDANNKTYASSTKLSELGISGGTISLNGKAIELTGDTTLSGLATKLKSAGVNASYDETNGRFFVSSTKSGADAEFSLVATDSEGLSALQALGLYAPTEQELAAYDAMANMSDADQAALAQQNYLASVNAAISAAQSKIEAAQSKIDAAQNSLDKLNDLRTQLSELEAKDSLTEEETAAKEKLEAQIAQYTEINEETGVSLEDQYYATIAEQQEIITEQQDVADEYNAYLETDEDGNFVTRNDDLYDEAVAKVNDQMSAAAAAASLGNSGGAVRIAAQDAIIYVNGAEFTGSTNAFSINGLNITATATTNVITDDDGNFISDDASVSITTATDTQGIYDKIKGFIATYNEMISYIDGLYYADAATGYEPLTDDEKEAMTDTQIEEWEKKIKDALLRRDSTLGSISSSLKNAFLSTTYSYNGKSYSLSSFGIATMSYFTAEASQRGTFHINGDPDDATTAGSTDKLMAAITADPDAVIGFFQTLSNNLHDTLAKKMESSTLSSAFTIYNDKQMSSQYSDYKDKVDEWEEKLTYYEDYYYSKFTAMEKALAQLNSSTSALSSLLGG